MRLAWGHTVSAVRPERSLCDAAGRVVARHHVPERVAVVEHARRSDGPHTHQRADRGPEDLQHAHVQSVQHRPRIHRCADGPRTHRADRVSEDAVTTPVYVICPIRLRSSGRPLPPPELQIRRSTFSRKKTVAIETSIGAAEAVIWTCPERADRKSVV